MVGWCGVGGAVLGRSFELPSAFVAQHVVAAAEQHQVVEVGGAAVLPGCEVMRVAPAGRPLAAGEGAVPVTVHEGASLGFGDEAGVAAEVEDLLLAVHDHAADRTVAGEPLDRDAGDRPDVFQFGAHRGEVDGLAIGESDRHDRVEVHPGTGGFVFGAGESFGGEGDERVGASL